MKAGRLEETYNATPPSVCPDTVSLASRTEVVNSLCDTENKNPPVVLGE